MSEGEIYCANHPQRETVLRCGKCLQPLCSDCLVHTPVGLRCRPCANIRPSPLYDVGPGLLLLATAAGLAAAVVGGFVVFTFLRPFALWVSWAYGLAVGEAVSAAARHKRGPNLQLIAIVSILIGAVVGKYWPLLALTVGSGGRTAAALLEAVGGDIWLMLFAGIAVLVGINRVR